MKPDFLNLLPEILGHAIEDKARECCGLVTVPRGKLNYHRCRNVAPVSISKDPCDQEFVISPVDYVEASADGIVAVVHSHLHASPEPSMADLVGCESSGLPWIIVSATNGSYKVIEPTNYKAPLIGRPFVHGVLDCFSLARDYYKEIGIDVLDFEREPEWWDKNQELLTPDNFWKAGFRIVSDGTLQKDDGIIMQNGKTDVANHVGVYLGDGVFIHHPGSRLSCKAPYGGYWEKVTRYVVRHDSKC